jgi:TolA-binding protein
MVRARVLCSVLLLGLGCGVGALASRPALAAAAEEPDRLWTVGEHAFQDGLYPLARRVLEHLIDRYPRDARVPEAALLLGKARFSQQAYAAALEAFRQALGASPVPGRPGEARFWEGESLFRMDRYAEAAAAYGQVLDQTPTSPLVPDALYGRGWCHRELKHEDLAIADFRQLLASYPADRNASSATVYLARLLVETKHPEDAVPLLRTFATRYPDHRLLPAARYTLGQALVASGETEDGVAELRAFLAAYPKDEQVGQARRLVIDTVLHKGSKTELAQQYEELMAQSPRTADTLYDAGVIAARLGREHDAEAAWTRLRKDFPDHPLVPRASLELAQAAFGRSAFKDAAFLSLAASKSEDDAVRAEGFLLLGESELRLKRYAPALRAFQSALGGKGLETGLRYRALAGSGLALEEQRKWADAAPYYDEVAGKCPDKTLRDWAKARRAAVAAKLKPAPDRRPTPKSATSGKGREPGEAAKR